VPTPDLAATARDLLLYTLWADRQVLDSLRGVAPEHLVRDTGSSFPSVLATMVHVLGAERIWLSRFSGVSLQRVPTVEDYPDLLSLILAWEETVAALEAFLAGLTTDQLAAPLTWTTTRGATHTAPLWQPVLHFANHSTYHRGQVVTMLRQLGYPAPSTDMVYWFLERPKPA
jgi:uncharacterized damage-inducible protein DinB